jgi:cbb3-type cytochrome oxidase maturation protein
MRALAAWILYMIVGVTVMVLVFLWAVRTGQFQEQDRARYLALHDDDLPQEDDEDSRTLQGFGVVPAVILTLGAFLVVWVIWLTLMQQ